MSKKKKYKREANKIRENILTQKEESKDFIKESLSKGSADNKANTTEERKKNEVRKVEKDKTKSTKAKGKKVLEKEPVILMGAPKKRVAELPVHDSSSFKTSTPSKSKSPEGKSVKIDFGDTVEHTTASKEQLPKIKNKKNIPINGVREHISLGKIFLWFLAFFVVYLIAGQMFNVFGPTTISLLSLWPLLLIFVGLSLFKVKKRGATRLIAGFFVLLIFAASVAMVFKGGNIVTINTNGEFVTEEREVDSFTEVSFEAVGDVKITLGDRDAVVIRADEAVIEEVETLVENGKLQVQYANSLWQLFLFDKTTIEVEIISKDISKISVGGKANAEVEGLAVMKLDFTISGEGSAEIRDLEVEEFIVRLNGHNESVKASGSAEMEYVLLRGKGTYDGTELTSAKTIVKIEGDALARVNTTNELSVVIEGPGKVIYRGEAVLKESIIKGKGSVLTEKEASELEERAMQNDTEESAEDVMKDAEEVEERAILNSAETTMEEEGQKDDSAVVHDAEGFLKSLNSKLE